MVVQHLRYKLNNVMPWMITVMDALMRAVTAWMAVAKNAEAL
jgi:hypothetical protein